MDTLWDKIQNVLKSAFLQQNGTKFDLATIVNTLRQLYKNEYRCSRGDNLVPFSQHCLSDSPIKVNKMSQYELVYRWNKGKDSEFVKEAFHECDIIPVGTSLDRIGPEYGRYLCPVPEDRDVYTIAERALPYFFLEDVVINEPAYHRYVVKKAISKEALSQAIEESDDVFESKLAKDAALEKVNTGNIVYGKVAPVDAFSRQGTGNGYQYKVLVAIYYLRALGFIEEVKQ